MVLATERFAAYVARIGTLVGVRAFVDEEIVGLGEMSLTVFADELLLGTTAGNRSSHTDGTSGTGWAASFAG